MQIEQSDIYVVGGANIDFLVLPFGEKLEYASLPSKIQRFFGGVARNIAENLEYLNMKTSLITAISKDKDGRELAQDCVKKNIYMGLSKTNCDYSTSKFIGIQTSKGQFRYAFSDMEILDLITPEEMKNKIKFINKSKLCILDSNLSVRTLDYILSECNVPNLVATVSPSKSTKILSLLNKIDFIAPTIEEVEILTGINITSIYDLSRSAEVLLNRGVKNVCIDHFQGIYFANKDENGFFEKLPTKYFKTDYGASDAFLAGIAFAKLSGPKKLSELVKFGMVASSICMSSNFAVNKEMNQDLFFKMLSHTEFKTYSQ